MKETKTIDQLRNEWKVAKKAADSLTLDFKAIESARREAAAAYKRYTEMLQV